VTAELNLKKRRRRKVELKRRERVLEIKRRRRRGGGNGSFLARSPCVGCGREHRSKNFSRCRSCTAPWEYARAIENNGQANIPAIDYASADCAARIESIRTFLETVSP
jgi:hypothetical protein